MKNIIIIQARMGSSRLPGKVLMPLTEGVVLDYVVKRCRRIKGINEVIVATSVLDQDNAIEKWCSDNEIACFRGLEDDVLSRYYECAKLYQPDYVLRVTADCPFVDFDMAENIIEKMMEHPADIVDVEGELPRGLVVEMVSFKALEYMNEHGHEERHREHVTYYAYEYRYQFTRTTYEVPENRRHPSLRITLDTEEDYDLCKAVAEQFQNPLVSSSDVIQYLLDYPEVAELNAHIEQKPVI